MPRPWLGTGDSVMSTECPALMREPIKWTALLINLTKKLKIATMWSAAKEGGMVL